MHDTAKFIAGLFAFITVQFFIRVFITLNFNVLFGPLVEQFWKHAKDYAHGHHKEHSPLKCEECSKAFLSMPD